MKALTRLLISILSLLFLSFEIALASAPPIQWQKTFGGSGTEYGESVQQTTDGGYIITGYTDSYGAGDYDVYLIKTDPNGNSQWQKTFGGTDEERAYSVQQTIDGGYIITGFTASYGAGRVDVFLIKTDPNGNSQWQKTFGDTSSDWGTSVQQTFDGGYIITGTTHSFDPPYLYIYLIKTDPNGDSRWQKTFSGSYGFSVQQTSDRGSVLSRYKSNNNNWLCKWLFEKLLKSAENRLFTGVFWKSMIPKTCNISYMLAGKASSFFRMATST